MPLLWISIAFVTGVVASLFLPIFWPVVAAIGIVFSLAAFLESHLLNRFAVYAQWRKNIPIPVCLLGAVLLGGMVRGEMGSPGFTPGDLAFYNGTDGVLIRAMASQPSESHDKSTLLTVTAKKISTDGISFTPVRGDAVILLPAGCVYKYGDQLEIQGKLETPPENDDFSYRQYLENRGVFSYLSYPQVKTIGINSGHPLMAVIFNVRDRIAVTTGKIIPQPEAAFLSGMLVGRDELIPDGLKDAFQNTGTSHLVAISGFNITILSALILALTSRLFSKTWSVITAILLLGLYSVMAGASPSVIRAALMGVLAIIGRSIGRTRTAVNSLGIAGGVMVLVNPLILRDIGFQLSVAATAGILLIGSPLNDRFVERASGLIHSEEANTLIRGLSESVIITFSAQLATLPFLLFHFHKYPLIGLLVNPIVLPVQPAAMVLGGLAVLAGIVFLPLGTLVGLTAWIPLAFTTKMIELFSTLSRSGTVNIHLELWQAALLGFLILTAVFVKRGWMELFKRYAYWGLCIVLFAFLVINLDTLYLSPDGRLHIWVFRQASDLSVFIQSPGGQKLLVTNRPGDKDLIAFLDRRLPFFHKKLDAVILPNPTSTTTVSLGESVDHYKPGWIFTNPEAGGGRVQSKIITELADSGLITRMLDAGNQFDLGRGALLQILQSDDKGSRIKLAWGKERIDIQYGNPSLDHIIEKPPAGPIDIFLMDHMEKIPEEVPGTILLSSVFQTSGITIPDGGWMEIRSDGNQLDILEKTNAGS